MTTSELMQTDINDDIFETMIQNIKVEHCPEDFEEITDDENDTNVNKFTNNKYNLNQQENKNKRDISIESNSNNLNTNLQVIENTHLINHRTANKNTNTYQILKKGSLLTTHICIKNCSWCNNSFAPLDTTNHIANIRKIEKYNAFLNIEPTLKLDSCICDRCWKFLEKTYKINEIERKKNLQNSLDSNKKIGVDSEHEKEKNVKEIDQEKEVENDMSNKSDDDKSEEYRKSKFDICSVHNCFKYSMYSISNNECIKIQNVLLKFDFSSMILVESKKKESNELCLYVCEEHFKMIDVVTMCQLCGNKLNEDLDLEDWKMYDKWNWILLCNNIPLTLQSGMFLCMTCKSYFSNSSLFRSIDLENLIQNVEKRNDVRLKIFGSPQDTNSDISQKLTVNLPIVIAKMFKFDNSTKVTFSDPLITKTYLFKPYIHDLDLENKENDCSYNTFNVLYDYRIKLNENTQTFDDSTETLFSNLNVVKDTMVSNNEQIIQNNNIKVNDIKIEPIDDSYENITNDSTQGEENVFQSITKESVDHSFELPTNQNLRSDFEVDEVVVKPDSDGIIKAENESLEDKFSDYYNDENMYFNRTDNTDNNVNNILNNNNNASSSSNHYDTMCEDDVKYLLPMHISNLDNDKNEISKNVENLQNNKPMMADVYSHQYIYKVEDTETDQCRPEIYNIYSQHHQNANRVETIVTNELEPTILQASDFSQPNMDVHHHDSIINLVDKQYVNNVSNIKKADLKKSKPCSYKRNHVVPIKKAKIDSIEIRNRLRNVVYQRFSSKGVKKQTLNETSELNNILIHESDNETDSSYLNDSIEDNESNENESINKNVKPLTIMNTFSFCKNANILSTDSTDKQDFLSEENAETFIVKDKNISSDKAINKPSLQIDKIFSLDTSYKSSIQFYRTLKKVPEFYKNKMIHIDKLKQNSFNNNKKSDLHKTTKYNSKMNRSKFITNPIKKFKFPCRYKSPNIENQSESSESDEKNTSSTIHFTFKNDSQRQLYDSLKAEFPDDSSLFLYLMENERKFYNGEFILAKEASSKTIDFVKKHVNKLFRWYGKPKRYHSMSFLRSSFLRDNLTLDRDLPNVTSLSNSIQLSAPVTTTRVVIPCNQVAQTQKKPVTKVSTISKPITSSKILKNSCTTTQLEKKTSKTNTNIHLPIVSKFISINQINPNNHRTFIQPRFRLPTAIRSGGTSFLQTRPSVSFFRAPSNSNLNIPIVRNAYKNGNIYFINQLNKKK